MARKRSSRGRNKTPKLSSPMPAMVVEKGEGVFQSRRGVKLFTCSWTPASPSPFPSSSSSSSPSSLSSSSAESPEPPLHPLPCKALVFLCHGYGMECSIFMNKTGEKLAQAGYSVFGLDYEGHGKSPGKRCYIHRFNDIVDDCYEFFHSLRSRPEYLTKPAFLYGESMGGAVALLLERKTRALHGHNYWSGAVLVAPMCKISENMLPPPWLRWLLIKLSSVIPTWKVVPTKDVIDQSFKDERKRQAIRDNPHIYKDRMILKTAVELLLTSLSLEKLLNEVRMPFIVLHGEEDTVTDPGVSRELYTAASSCDKTMKIYTGMWHGLTTGEPDRNVDAVFRDVTGWLDKRSCKSFDTSFDAGLDGLKKLEHDPLATRGLSSFRCAL